MRFWAVVTDEDIKALLRILPQSSFIRTEPPGMAAILCSRVEDDATAEECKRWVERNGGYEGISFRPTSNALGRGMGVRHPGGPEPYWAIPLGALA